MRNSTAPCRPGHDARAIAVCCALAPAQAAAMDANAGLFMLAVWGAFLSGAVAGTLAGWRGWRIWGSLWRSYLVFSALLALLILVFSTRGMGDVIGLTILNLPLQTIPWAIAFVFGFALGSAFAPATGTRSPRVDSTPPER